MRPQTGHRATVEIQSSRYSEAVIMGARSAPLSLGGVPAFVQAMFTV